MSPIWAFHFALFENVNPSLAADSISGNVLPLVLTFKSGLPLPREQIVKYLGVHFNSNLTWSTHIDSVYTKCLKISFFIRRLRSLNIHKPLLWRLVFACAIPINLYCSPIIFSGLLNKDFASIKKCIRLLSTSSGVAYTHICKTLPTL